MAMGRGIMRKILIELCLMVVAPPLTKSKYKMLRLLGYPIYKRLFSSNRLQLTRVLGIISYIDFSREALTGFGLSNISDNSSKVCPLVSTETK